MNGWDDSCDLREYWTLLNLKLPTWLDWKSHLIAGPNCWTAKICISPPLQFLPTEETYGRITVSHALPPCLAGRFCLLQISSVPLSCVWDFVEKAGEWNFPDSEGLSPESTYSSWHTQCEVHRRRDWSMTHTAGYTLFYRMLISNFTSKHCVPWLCCAGRLKGRQVTHFDS